MLNMGRILDDIKKLNLLKDLGVEFYVYNLEMVLQK